MLLQDSFTYASVHCVSVSLDSLGKRKNTPPCSSEELFFAEKMGATEERFLW